MRGSDAMTGCARRAGLAGLTAIVVLGSTLGAAGPAVALSGNVSTGDAAAAQYIPSSAGGQTLAGPPGVSPVSVRVTGSSSGSGGSNAGGSASKGGTKSKGGSKGSSANGTNDSSTPVTTPSTPVSASANTSAGSLPFTGYALLALVAIGLCLLSVGAMVRRRTRPAAK